MIRPATIDDVPRVLGLMREMHARSIYREQGSMLDEVARPALARAIARHGQTGYGGSVVFVFEHGTRVDGMIVGILQRVYHVLDLLQATDWAWYHSGPGDGLALGEAFIEWALKVPTLAEIAICPNDALGDHKRLEPWLERKGFARHGSMFRRTP